MNPEEAIEIAMKIQNHVNDESAMPPEMLPHLYRGPFDCLVVEFLNHKNGTVTMREYLSDGYFQARTFTNVLQALDAHINRHKDWTNIGCKTSADGVITYWTRARRKSE